MLTNLQCCAGFAGESYIYIVEWVCGIQLIGCHGCSVLGGSGLLVPLQLSLLAVMLI